MIEIADLDFRYGAAWPQIPAAQMLSSEAAVSAPSEPALHVSRLSLPAGARCLLVGRNGAGKTTLLEILAGRRLVPPTSVKILGRPAFLDPSLVHDVAYIGQLFAFTSDITVSEILSRQTYDPARLEQLIEVLGVNLRWSMWRVSQGQRRRVHLLLTLLQPKRVLLIDEATSELDLICRLDLLEYLQKDSAARSCTIIYASHVFDGLESWPTHLLWLKRGRVEICAKLDELDDLRQQQARGASAPLMRTIEHWLRSDV